MNIPDLYTLPTIEMVGGTTKELSFHGYSNQDRKPFDLSDCTANFSIINFVNKHGIPQVSKDMSIDISDTGDVELGSYIYNVMKVMLLPEDTVGMYGKYIYQISIKDHSNNVDASKGIMYIDNNINREFVV